MEARRTGEFIGRSAELDALGGLIRAADQGAPSIALVSGETGIGKSRLLTEAAARSDCHLYIGRCVHVGGDPIALAPLIDLVRHARRVTRRSSSTVPPALEALAALLRPDPPAARASHDTGSIFEATLDLVDQLAGGQATLIAFEDLHWADDLTWDLFEFLARNLVDEPVVLIGTHRANETHAHPTQRQRLSQLARLPATYRLDLHGFDRDDTAKLVLELSNDFDPALIDAIATRSAGNPLFTEELVAFQGGHDSIPPLLSDLLANDIEQLEPLSRRIAEIVATLGRETPHGLISATTGADDPAVEAAIRSALAAQILIRSVGGDSYEFRHPLIGEVVTSSLLPSERRRHHAGIADALRNHPEFALSATAAAGELAFHLERAGDLQGAFHASLEAADALAAVSEGAALRHLERALGLWPPGDEPAERVRRLWQAAELSYVTGDGERAVQLGVLASADAASAHDAAWAHERLARYLWTAGRLVESEAEYAQAAELLDHHSDLLEQAAVHAGLAQADLLFCRYDEAETACLRALDIVDDPSVQPEIWLHARRVLGVAHAHRGAFDQAIEFCRTALLVARSAADRALATIYLVEALMQASRYDEAVMLALDGAAEGTRAGLDASLGGYLSAMATEGLTWLGRWSEAEQILSRLDAESAIPVTAVRIDLAAADLALRRGDLEPAAAALDHASTQEVDPWHHNMIRWTTANVALHSGDLDHAETTATYALSLRCTQDARWPARFAMVLAAVALERHRDAVARRTPDHAATTEDLRDRVTSAMTRGTDVTRTPDANAHLAHAEALVTLIERPDAKRWTQAIAAWDAVGDPWMGAIARVHRAESAIAERRLEAATDDLRSAHTFALGHEASPLLHRIDSLARLSRLDLGPPEPTTIHHNHVLSLGLTPREAEVLALVAAGRTNRQIANELFISEKTASVHVSNILRKLGVTNRVEAGTIAHRLGVPDPST